MIESCKVHLTWNPVVWPLKEKSFSVLSNAATCFLAIYKMKFENMSNFDLGNIWEWWDWQKCKYDNLFLPHSPIATTVSSLPVTHASTSREQLFGYVWPSDPQTGIKISGQISLQTQVAMPSTTWHWCREWLHSEMSQGSVGTIVNGKVILISLINTKI